MELDRNAVLTAASCAVYWKLDEECFLSHTNRERFLILALNGHTVLSHHWTRDSPADRDTRIKKHTHSNEIMIRCLCLLLFWQPYLQQSVLR